MLTLHDATDLTKKFLLWGVVGIIGIIVITFVVGLIQSAIKKPIPPPSVCYGKIPNISFPKNNLSQQQFNYNLNTITGNLPQMPDRIVVPKIASITPSLFALDNASASANLLGFDSTSNPIDTTTYQWVKNSDIQKILRLNILTNDFTVTSNFYTDPTVLSAQNMPLQDSAIANAESYINTLISQSLTSNTKLPDDVDTNNPLVGLYNIDSKQLNLVKAQNPTLAQVYRIDFFQKNIDNCYNDSSGNKSCPIFYPNSPHSPISIYIASGQETQSNSQGGQIVEAEYFHRSFNDPTCPSSSDAPTYPIISAQVAYKGLQKGNGYIASYSGTGTSVSIKDIKLGYYLGIDGTQQYLFPVIIFSGDNDFIGYVPALVSGVVQN